MLDAYYKLLTRNCLLLIEALILSSVGTAFVFIFLGLLVFAVKAMSACSNLIVKPEPLVNPSRGTNALRQQVALAAATIHHHKASKTMNHE